ncbi:MAG: hypothetical protein ACO4CS_16795 [bacterium]
MKIKVHETCFGPTLEVDGSYLPPKKWAEFAESHLEVFEPLIYSFYKACYEDNPEECLLWVFSEFAEWKADWWEAEWHGVRVGTDHGFPDLLGVEGFKELLVEIWLQEANANLAWALEDILQPLDTDYSSDICETCGNHEATYIYEV